MVNQKVTFVKHSKSILYLLVIHMVWFYMNEHINYLISLFEKPFLDDRCNPVTFFYGELWVDQQMKVNLQTISNSSRAQCVSAFDLLHGYNKCEELFSLLLSGAGVHKLVQGRPEFSRMPVE